MGSQKRLLICVGLGVVMFVMGMAYLIYGAIAHREPYLIGLAFGMGGLLILPVIGVILEARSGRTVARAPPAQGMSPTMRYEGGGLTYCPMCHANLGANPPKKCPECGHDL